ncbi:dynein light chain Tctex-type protein 2-like isoform X2 [Heptranchias perlo]|uniref:dynein light chain Tctex-type protein 2-like isoform X2 n=1 Tax=Heptranchias perlo TaxID=212740 RepID=UPI0035599B9A
MEEEEEETEALDEMGGEADDDMDELKSSVPVGRMGLPLRKKIARAFSDQGELRRGAPGRQRRSSVFEENAFHEILKERLHDTILQVVHADKSELEEEDDDVFEEPLTWKPSLVKQKMANTYKMVPDKEFDFAAVAKRIDELLEIASKFLWDPEHDSWCAGLFQTTRFFVVGTVYAVYFE